MALVAEDEVEKRIASGQYHRGEAITQSVGSFNPGMDMYTEKIFGMCRKCAVIDLPLENEITQQRRRIQARLALIREKRLDLTLEQAAHAAVEDEFEARNEPNPDFRAYLLERAEKDEASDETARAVLASLPDDDAAGAV